jgi:hypothetical protein
MFTTGDRHLRREARVEAARSDERVTGAALTGSAALWAQADFGATSPKFRLLFGTAQDRPAVTAPF